ncbi:Pr6Pr family membrane protein [Herbiconiux sp. P15]|uniref:Pr6Pr family membrane protein n=1 Tax=Herbiconiux liukaitaii TaxID=3342799 RepID=UPI0035B770E1
MRRVFGIIRIVAAGVIIAAIVAQLVHSIALVPDVPHFLVNFFSYFTILSNALAALALLVGAYYSFTVRRDPAWYNLALAAIVTYMATTGVVYNLLLRGIALDQGSTVPWSNEVLHLVAPIYIVVVWILTPGKSPLKWSAVGSIVVFPLVWVVYTMIRGPLVGWYPYPFLNPAQPGGYGAVAVYVIAIAGFIGIMACAVVALSRTRLLRA